MMWVVVWGAVARPQLRPPGPHRWGAGSIPWGCRHPHTTEASLWLVIIRLPYNQARSFTSAQSRPQAVAGLRTACEARWGLRVHLEAGEETAHCLRSMGALVTREQPVSCWTVRSCETEAGTTWPPGNRKGLGAWDWVGWCWGLRGGVVARKRSRFWSKLACQVAICFDVTTISDPHYIWWHLLTFPCKCNSDIFIKSLPSLFPQWYISGQLSLFDEKELLCLSWYFNVGCDKDWDRTLGEKKWGGLGICSFRITRPIAGRLSRLRGKRARTARSLSIFRIHSSCTFFQFCDALPFETIHLESYIFDQTVSILDEGTNLHWLWYVIVEVFTLNQMKSLLYHFYRVRMNNLLLDLALFILNLAQEFLAVDHI